MGFDFEVKMYLDSATKVENIVEIIEEEEVIIADPVPTEEEEEVVEEIVEEDEEEEVVQVESGSADSNK
jgi:hypothetical protein